MVGGCCRLVGGLVGWLVRFGWFGWFGRLGLVGSAGGLVCWFGWLFGWLVGCLVGWLVWWLGWLVWWLGWVGLAGLVGWLVGSFVGWFGFHSLVVSSGRAAQTALWRFVSGWVGLEVDERVG